MTEPVLTNDPTLTALEIYQKAMDEQRLHILFFGGTKSATHSNLRDSMKSMLRRRNLTASQGVMSRGQR